MVDILECFLIYYIPLEQFVGGGGGFLMCFKLKTLNVIFCFVLIIFTSYGGFIVESVLRYTDVTSPEVIFNYSLPPTT